MIKQMPMLHRSYNHGMLGRRRFHQNLVSFSGDYQQHLMQLLVVVIYHQMISFLRFFLTLKILAIPIAVEDLCFGIDSMILKVITAIR